MAYFDFHKYLSNIDPSQQYEISTLTGGRVNIVVRAVKTTPQQIDHGNFAGHQSLVLKYAPPYIALDGEGAPFSQFRQTIESRALSLFADPDGELFQLCCRWNIKVPQLLHHDQTFHVLIIEDLGELDTLTDQLKQMLQEGTGESLAVFSQLGHQLGGFMGDLHSMSTLEKLHHKITTHFDQPGIKDVIYNNVITQIRGRLEDFSVPDASELYRRIEEDHLWHDQLWEQKFVLGDFWTGSILMKWPKVCLIDWEFAGIYHGAHQDMATFLAQLHLYLLASETESRAYFSMWSLILCTVDSYRRQLQISSKELDADKEMKSEGVNDRTGRKAPESTAANLPVELLHTVRSAFIVHGRKMINNAVERDWACKCCIDDQKLKQDDISASTVKMKQSCKLFGKMMNRGIWYLRTAAFSVTEFSEDHNWAEAMTEEGKVILGLFFEA